MPIPRVSNERCLILSDGGLESAVISAIASEQTTRGDTNPPMVLASWWGSQEDLDLILPSIDRAVSRQSEMFGLSMIPDQTGYPPEQSDNATPLSHGSMQTQLLLHAAACAARMGIRRLIWPVRIGTDQRDFEPSDIDRLARVVDRALLAARIATLDAQDESEGEDSELTIETPLVDFSNSQLADLAGDLAVSLQSCWWFHDRQVLPSAQTQYAYWSGLSMLNSSPHGSGVEIKPTRTEQV